MINFLKARPSLLQVILPHMFFEGLYELRNLYCFFIFVLDTLWILNAMNKIINRNVLLVEYEKNF